MSLLCGPVTGWCAHDRCHSVVYILQPLRRADVGWCFCGALAGMVLRSAVYLIMYYTYSQPRAVVWQLYVVTCGIFYACQGQAFLLSQVGAGV